MTIDISDWYLVEQPIWKFIKQGPVLKKELLFNELLLRSSKTDNFPAKEFTTLTKTTLGNKLIFDWLTNQIFNILAHNPKKIISINIDPLQAISKNFMPFLKNIHPFNCQIFIELTERVTREMDTNDVMLILNNINQAGFKVLLDDIDMVDDTIKLEKLLRYIVGLKLSADLVDNSEVPKINKLLEFLKNYNQCCLIGEGTSNSEIFYLYLNHGVLAQQGWFFDKEKIVT